MPCCTYYSERELNELHETADKEIRELIEEVERTTGARFYIWHRKYRTGWFWWKRERTTYQLFSPTILPEVQIINFGPAEVGGSSIGEFVSRQAIAGFLFGYLNGYREGATR